jgi:hypothetical protein
MALFIDGPVAAVPDLTAYESSILDTASTEAIDITNKLNIAHREVGFEISAFLAKHGHSLPAELGRVMATEPVLHAECLRTLELTYRDAYNSQLNDRYLGKWKEYAALSTRAMSLLFEIGVGLSSAPVARAVAPTIATVSGGVLGTRTYAVSVAWQSTTGVEGARSTPQAAMAAAGTLAMIEAGSRPLNAIGYHVYAGPSEAEMQRQTMLPIASGTAWIEPTYGLRNDLAPVPAQSPDWFVTSRRVLRRG